MLCNVGPIQFSKLNSFELDVYGQKVIKQSLCLIIQNSIRTSARFKVQLREITKYMYSLLYVFLWVIPRRLNFICRLFGTLCLFHLHRLVGDE
jgi:hypothetical protein